MKYDAQMKSFVKTGISEHINGTGDKCSYVFYALTSGVSML